MVNAKAILLASLVASAIGCSDETSASTESLATFFRWQVASDGATECESIASGKFSADYFAYNPCPYAEYAESGKGAALSYRGPLGEISGELAAGFWENIDTRHDGAFTKASQPATGFLQNGTPAPGNYLAFTFNNGPPWSRRGGDPLDRVEKLGGPNSAWLFYKVGTVQDSYVASQLTWIGQLIDTRAAEAQQAKANQPDAEPAPDVVPFDSGSLPRPEGGGPVMPDGGP